MIMVAGKPFLYHQLALLKRQGITRLLILVGYLGQRIMDYFEDGSWLGLQINYSVEDDPLGTAGALKKAEPHLEEEFLLLYGDSYLPIEYQDVARAFWTSGKRGLMVVFEDKDGSTMVRKNVALDGQMTITSYEKDSLDKTLQYVEAGVLAFRREVMDFIPPDRAVSLEEEVFPLLIAQQQLLGYVAAQRFYDMGTPERLDTLRRFLG
jgi:NDP-sugar pyrophosphorylase family protein